jgi:competence protein ComEC
MPLGQKAFWFFIFFIVGVFLAGVGIHFLLLVLGVVLLFLVLLFVGAFKQNAVLISLGFLVLAVALGGVYFQWYQRSHLERDTVQYGVRQRMTGIVSSHPQSSPRSQGFLLRTGEGNTLFIRTTLFEDIAYADIVTVEGVVQPLDETTRYLVRDGAVGTISFPALVTVTTNTQFSLQRSLFDIRERFVNVFGKTLPADSASLASGILLGQESAGFSRELKDAMKRSGTTHLVALSGYNISILVIAIFSALGYILWRRSAAVVALLIIAAFVVMTGAEASVVRAAVMGSMVIVAEFFSRLYDFKHSMAVAAFVMVALNPLILFYDVGFLLSFVALCGITYLGASLAKCASFSNRVIDGVKNLFCETASAQLAVIPILSAFFGQFSLAGLVSNVVILPLVPLLMGVSFVQGCAGMIYGPLANVLALAVAPIAGFMIFVMRFFAQAPSITAALGWVGVAAYYVVLVLAARLLYVKTRGYEYRA